MPQYAAFLRAVNLGPTNKVSSAQLCEEFEAAGFTDVATFRTSGNVVFSAEPKSEKKLVVKIEKQLAESLGFDVPVLLRSAAELEAIAQAEPFDAKLVEASKGKLQVLVAGEAPADGAKEEVLALATDEDQLAFGERELFWLPSGGYSDSELDLKAIGKLIGVNTARTMGTIQGLAQKYLQND